MNINFDSPYAVSPVLGTLDWVPNCLKEQPKSFKFMQVTRMELVALSHALLSVSGYVRAYGNLLLLSLQYCLEEPSNILGPLFETRRSEGVCSAAWLLHWEENKRNARNPDCLHSTQGLCVTQWEGWSCIPCGQCLDSPRNSSNMLIHLNGSLHIPSRDASSF